MLKELLSLKKKKNGILQKYLVNPKEDRKEGREQQRINGTILLNDKIIDWNTIPLTMTLKVSRLNR